MNRSQRWFTSTLVVAFTLLLSPQIWACSCGGFPSFCEEAVFQNKILVEVIDHQIATYPGGFEEYFTQVKLLVDIDGAAYPDTISLVNQNGVNCNGDIFGMPSGDTLVVSLPYAEITSWPEELSNVPPYTTYDLFGCGTYFLEVNDGKLGGGNADVVNLTDFLNSPFSNCPFVNSTEEIDPFGLIQKGPNPVVDNLRLINFTEETVSFHLYSIDGKPLHLLELQTKQAGDLPMSDLPAGVYVLRQQAVLGEKSVLVVKQ